MSTQRPASDPRSRTTAGEVATFLLVAAVVTLAALNGGTYDLVVRQEAALVLCWVLAATLLAGVLPRTRPGPLTLVALGTLALLGAWTALSFLWTSSAERTLVEVARVGAHLGLLALVVGSLDRSVWRAAVAGATVGAAAVCAYALGTRLHHGFLGSHNEVAGFVGDQRLSLPFNYWNAVGAWAGMTSALCLGWSAHAGSRTWRGLALAALPVSLLVSYLTFSRASLGGTAVGLIVLLAVSGNRWTLVANGVVAALAGALAVLVVRGYPEIDTGSGESGAAGVAGAALVLAAGCGVFAALLSPRLDRLRIASARARRVLNIGACVGAVALVVAAVSLAPRAWDSFNTTGVAARTDDPATRLRNLNGTRRLVWGSALDTFASHPVLGTGAGTFEFSWNEDARGSELVKDAHSLYLEAMSELGLPGLLLVLAFVAALIAAIASLLRREHTPSERGALAAVSGAGAAYLFGAGFDWLWEATGVTVLALVVLGAALSAAGTSGPRVRTRTRALAAAGCLLVFAAQLPGLVSTSESRRSADAIRAGNVLSAREHANNGIDAQPWAASPYVQRALVEEFAGDLDAAAADLRLAEKREMKNWRIPLITARVQARRGDADAALAAYRRAQALRPAGRFFARQP